MSAHLGELNPGDCARVTGFARGDKAFRKRLLAMGLTAGTRLEVVRTAPLGDPVEIRVRGVSMSLRRGEAVMVQVAPESAL
ncbi:MAG: FeoA family protein [Gammaproteobacteria bacterium]